ncbi:MAG: helix-hairpin-helix domain-containing protein [Desulfobacterales bacterium]|nr:helix-hairpin-helix domain-containing protein [Desulfobacterales bacterium]
MRNFGKHQLVILLVFGLVIATVNLLRPFDPFLSRFKSSHYGPKPCCRQQWIVEVTGAVKKPGIYAFHNPPTIHQAIRAAGGTTKSTLTPLGVPPEHLETGALLEVKPLGSQTAKLMLFQMSAGKRLSLGIPIEVNEAQVEDLALIPGVGQALARRIIEFRESHGPFKTWNDLRRVKGIGPRKVESFRSYLELAQK